MKTRHKIAAGAAGAIAMAAVIISLGSANRRILAIKLGLCHIGGMATTFPAPPATANAGIARCPRCVSARMRSSSPSGISGSAAR